MYSIINLAKSSVSSLPSSFNVLINADIIASFFIIFISLKCLSTNFDFVTFTIVFGKRTTSFPTFGSPKVSATSSAVNCNSFSPITNMSCFKEYNSIIRMIGFEILSIVLISTFLS
ncbi:hypothetical protein LguiA_035766 [Lonicera macranthoides]